MLRLAMFMVLPVDHGRLVCGTGSDAARKEAQVWRLESDGQAPVVLVATSCNEAKAAAVVRAGAPEGGGRLLRGAGGFCPGPVAALVLGVQQSEVGAAADGADGAAFRA